MNTIRVLIADDEGASRASLKALLQVEKEYEVVGECERGTDLAAAVAEHRPHLLFLDVQMPGQTGVAALAALEAPTPPAVVFVTAFEEHALRAFDLDAVDYLLKPYSDARFHLALQRARARLDQRIHSSSAHAHAHAPAQLGVRTGTSVKIVRLCEIEWIEAVGDYARLHTQQGAHLLRSTMAQLEARLNPCEFVRVHRSTIVAAAAVLEVRTARNGEAEVVLNSGVSRRLSERGKELLARALAVPL